MTAFEEKDGSTVFFGLDNQADDDPVCPVCANPEYRSLLTGGRSVGVKGYPYFDAGAGRWFESATERRKWMKDNNLVCLDGELDSLQGDIRRGQEAEAVKHDKVYAEMNRSVGSDPEYLTARDKGLAPSLGIQEAKKP